MGDLRTCYLCNKSNGIRADHLVHVVCGACDYAMATWWPISLGLSIRRFVRACEVEGLRDRVYVGLHESHASAGQRAALDRLAALAMGGDDD